MKTIKLSEVKLVSGTVQVYNFDNEKLHVYATNDALSDYSFLLETADGLVGIEAPAFNDNLNEYVEYINGLGKPLSDIFISSHPTGADTDLYANARVHATQTVIDAIADGGSVKGLTEGFVQAFGDSFNANVVTVTDVIEAGTTMAGGLEFVITENGDGYDIKIPAINSVYTHMMGSDVHNILSSVQHMDAMIAQFQGYQADGVNLVLTSHYAPETLDAVAVKIAYLEKAKDFAKESANAAQFIEKMKAEFLTYGGVNYLEMSAGMLFPES